MTVSRKNIGSFLGWSEQRVDTLFERDIIKEQPSGVYLKSDILAVVGNGTHKPELQPFPKSPNTFIYFVQDDDAIKIGRARDIESRLPGIQSGNPRPIVLLGYYSAHTSEEIRLHKKFRPHRIRGEWFKDHPELRELIAHKCPPIAATVPATMVAATRE